MGLFSKLGINNPGTTIPGLLLFIGGSLVAIAKLLQGEKPDLEEVASAAAGIGLIRAKSGGL